MGVKREVDEGQRRVTIKVDGHFVFSEHKAFRDAYRDMPAGGMGYVVDLGGSSYLDSSALGMLLLLREHAGSEAAEVRIRNANADVRRVLRIANFERLFTVE